MIFLSSYFPLNSYWCEGKDAWNGPVFLLNVVMLRRGFSFKRIHDLIYEKIFVSASLKPMKSWFEVVLERSQVGSAMR